LESGRTRAITPSGAASFPASRDGTEAPDGFESAEAASNAAPAAAARERGKLTHLLLQVLPPERPEERRRAGERIVLANRFSVGVDEARIALEEVLQILEDPTCRDLFGPQSRAEVPIAGRLRISGADIDVAGQIDRLAIGPDWVTACDFKTNTHLPDKAADAPRAYILQLALYRGLLRETFPDREIRCKLLWTRTGRLMEIGESLLDKAIESMTFS
jgi:ATP-dependent helicase/nuclease subunit A